VRVGAVELCVGVVTDELGAICGVPGVVSPVDRAGAEYGCSDRLV
jgi:hypothetical protein